MTKTKQVKVLDLAGNVIGYVSDRSTSIGAAKLAGMSVRHARRNGEWVWESYSPRWSGQTARQRVGGTFGS